MEALRGSVERDMATLIRKWLLMYFVEQLHLARVAVFFLREFEALGKHS